MFWVSLWSGILMGSWWMQKHTSSFLPIQYRSFYWVHTGYILYHNGYHRSFLKEAHMLFLAPLVYQHSDLCWNWTHLRSIIRHIIRIPVCSIWQREREAQWIYRCLAQFTDVSLSGAMPAACEGCHHDYSTLCNGAVKQCYVGIYSSWQCCMIAHLPNAITFNEFNLIVRCFYKFILHVYCMYICLCCDLILFLLGFVLSISD